MSALGRAIALILFLPSTGLAEDAPRAVLTATPASTREAVADASAWRIEIDLPKPETADAVRRPGYIRVLREDGVAVPGVTVRAQAPMIGPDGAFRHDSTGRTLYRRAIAFGPFQPDRALSVHVAGDSERPPLALSVAAASSGAKAAVREDDLRVAPRLGAGGAGLAVSGERRLAAGWSVLKSGGHLRHVAILAGHGDLALAADGLDHRMGLAPMLRLDVTPRLGLGRAWPVRVELEPFGLASGAAAGPVGVTSALRVIAPLPGAGRLLQGWLEGQGIAAYAAAPVLSLAYRGTRPLVPGRGYREDELRADLVATLPLDDVLDLDLSLRAEWDVGRGGFTPAGALGLTWWRDRAAGIGLSAGIDTSGPENDGPALITRMRVPFPPSARAG